MCTHTHAHTQLVFQAGEQRRHELQAMRDRHKERFIEATAKLRSQHKALGKRVRLLESQLMKNSVRYPIVASYPGLFTPVFVTCGTNAGEGLVEMIT